MGGDIGSIHKLENAMKVPNDEEYKDRRFQTFEAANQLLYDGCIEGITQLYSPSHLMKVRTDHNLR